MDTSAFIQEHISEFEQLLAKLIHYADFSETGEQIKETADFIKHLLKKALDAQVEVHQTEGSPVIIATLSPGKQLTYLFYGHYDVQTPGNLNNWSTDPFKLTKKKDRFYGRGVGDNKGQLIAQICGLYVYKKLNGDLPFTVKLFIEGEEESGSPHLKTTVQELKHTSLNDVQAAFVIDGSFSQSGQHVLRLGNRGILAFRLSTKTSDQDLHSGNFGNVSRNAAEKLIAIINKLIDPQTQRPRVPALQKNIRPMTKKERAWINKLPAPKNIPSALYRSKEDYYRRLMFQPTLTVNGLTSGYQGSKVKTIIPGSATAVFDIRLVVDQNYEDVRDDIEKILQKDLKYGQVKLKWLVGLNPTKVDSSNSLVNPIYQAIKTATGDCLIEPSMPGSVPNDVWAKTLGVPVFTIPYANYDQHNHAPNENLLVSAFTDGIKITVEICKALAQNLT